MFRAAVCVFKIVAAGMPLAFPRRQHLKTGDAGLVSRLIVLPAISRPSLPRSSSGSLPDLCSRGVRASRSLGDGAGGFLPGVPLRLGIVDRHHNDPQPTRFLKLIGFPMIRNPGPSKGHPQKGRVGPGPREAMSDNHTQESNAGHCAAFLDRDTH
jgi:hypothetical protein